MAALFQARVYGTDTFAYCVQQHFLTKERKNAKFRKYISMVHEVEELYVDSIQPEDLKLDWMATQTVFGNGIGGLGVDFENTEGLDDFIKCFRGAQEARRANRAKADREAEDMAGIREHGHEPAGAAAGVFREGAGATETGDDVEREDTTGTEVAQVTQIAGRD
jgi:hypothetical protein